MRLLYSFTIGCSSVLLFLLQPIMAKALLPRFGGSAGVWVTCMLFFQVMLLLGYLYSWLVTRHLGRKSQTAVHAMLLILSLATLSLKPRLDWVGPATDNPALSILGVLLFSIGLPYFLLSTTSPLMQAWFAESASGTLTWRFFALSNAASLLALLAYPVLIERLLPGSVQLLWWWTGYATLVFLACATAFVHRSGNSIARNSSATHSAERPLLWIGLAACASTLWMAVANHLSQEVAPVPFLWVLPLSVYLLSFILCFEGEGWYRPTLFRWLLPVAWFSAAYRIAGQGPPGLIWEIGTFSAALFLWCMFCHGEIARMKPVAPDRVTFFYLMIALGGALERCLSGSPHPTYSPRIWNCRSGSRLRPCLRSTCSMESSRRRESCVWPLSQWRLSLSPRVLKRDSATSFMYEISTARCRSATLCLADSPSGPCTTERLCTASNS